ncbi:hypothetical protein D3C85_1866190 [compost metagenome]
MPPETSLRRAAPPTATATIRPVMAPTPKATGKGISGLRRKLLKPMAPYSFSSTATQKMGSEKNRNAMNVTP